MKAVLKNGLRRTLDFDVEFGIVAGFSLHWAWIWVGFWSSAFYSVGDDVISASASSSVEPLWMLSLLANAVGLIVLFVASGRCVHFASRASVPLCSAVLTSVGTLIVSNPAVIPIGSEELVYCLGSLMTGVGSAVAFVLWGELLSILGTRKSLVYCTASTVVGGLAYFLFSVADPAVARLAMAIAPAVEMWLFVRCSGGKAMGERADAPVVPAVLEGEAKARFRKDIAALVGISLFFGASYGVMRGFFSFDGAHETAVRDAANIAAFIVGALAILVTASVFRMDFNHLTYQIALPLMAVGFAVISLDGVARIMGFFIHQVGYQYFNLVLWAMWPALAKNNEGVPIARFCCAGMASMQAGQLIGSLFGGWLMRGDPGKYDLAMMSVIAVFVVLLVALFGFSNPASGSGWGLMRPVDGSMPAPRFRRTLDGLAKDRGLSEREAEVFALLARGRNCAYIGKELVISEPTVKTHMRNIYRKLGVHSQQALIDVVEFEMKNG